MEKKHDIETWKEFTESSVSILLLSLKKLEPVKPDLAKYLSGCSTEQIREYFKTSEGIDPLILTVNEKMYILDFKPFIEKGKLFETTTIKLNSII